MDWHNFKETLIHSYMSINLLHVTSSTFFLRKGLWNYTPTSLNTCVAALLSLLSPPPIRWKDFLQGSKKMLETKSYQIRKDMKVLGKTSSASCTMQSQFMPLVLKLQKEERTPNLGLTQCNLRAPIVMDLCMESIFVGHTFATPISKRRK